MSNTEMVSVPRELLHKAVNGHYFEHNVALRDLRELLAQPAEQHQGESVALPAKRPRRMNDQRDDAYDNGWNNCLDEIAKLGPLYTRPTQGEPVAWFRVGDDGREYCEKPFTTDWEPLYTHADPGEVERLHKEHIKALEACSELSEKQRDHWMAECKKRDAKLAERDALLREWLDDLEKLALNRPAWEKVAAIKAALSASAEPELNP